MSNALDENKYIDRSLVEGDNDFITLGIFEPDGVTVIPTTGWTGWLTIKADYEDEDTAAIWQDVSNPTGDDATNGLIPLEWNLENADANTIYVYDIQVKDTSGVIRTWDRGKISVLPEVTKARV